MSVTSQNTHRPPLHPCHYLLPWQQAETLHWRMKSVCWSLPVCPRIRIHMLSFGHRRMSVCFLVRWRAQFPLQDRESRVGCLPLSSPSFLLYRFGSAKSQGDMMQALYSFSHTQRHRNHDNGFSCRSSIVASLDKLWQECKLQPVSAHIKREETWQPVNWVVSYSFRTTMDFYHTDKEATWLSLICISFWCCY